MTTYRFCPVCGGPLEGRLLKAGDPERLVCIACGYVLYLDPKVAVGTIISVTNGPIVAGAANDPGESWGRVVLVRRAIEPGYGLWVFPGGYVDRGEPPALAAIREAREECGLHVRLDRLINVYAYPNRAPIIIVYAATALGGELCHDDECLEAKWFAEEEIPWDELAFDSTRDALREYFRSER